MTAVYRADNTTTGTEVAVKQPMPLGFRVRWVVSDLGLVRGPLGQTTHNLTGRHRVVPGAGPAVAGRATPVLQHGEVPRHRRRTRHRRMGHAPLRPRRPRRALGRLTATCSPKDYRCGSTAGSRARSWSTCGRSWTCPSRARRLAAAHRPRLRRSGRRPHPSVLRHIRKCDAEERRDRIAARRAEATSPRSR